ncbi:hypothetical protein JTB14_012981 [Gonioctena quinquepunctata]|nr:hypothetical protein JTB14_012981 [Gonioctena quinquepunctata]
MNVCELDEAVEEEMLKEEPTEIEPFGSLVVAESWREQKPGPTLKKENRFEHAEFKMDTPEIVDVYEDIKTNICGNQLDTICIGPEFEKKAPYEVSIDCVTDLQPNSVIEKDIGESPHETRMYNWEFGRDRIKIENDCQFDITIKEEKLKEEPTEFEPFGKFEVNDESSLEQKQYGHYDPFKPKPSSTRLSPDITLHTNMDHTYCKKRFQEHKSEDNTYYSAIPYGSDNNSEPSFCDSPNNHLPDTQEHGFADGVTIKHENEDQFECAYDLSTDNAELKKETPEIKVDVIDEDIKHDICGNQVSSKCIGLEFGTNSPYENSVGRTLQTNMDHTYSKKGFLEYKQEDNCTMPCGSDTNSVMSFSNNHLPDIQEHGFADGVTVKHENEDNFECAYELSTDSAELKKETPEFKVDVIYEDIEPNICEDQWSSTSIDSGAGQSNTAGEIDETNGKRTIPGMKLQSLSVDDSLKETSSSYILFKKLFLQI